MDDNMDDLNAIINILDAFGNSAESRMKLDISNEMKDGETAKQYHLGRCDIGSPWECGTAFDVLEEEDEEERHPGE